MTCEMGIVYAHGIVNLHPFNMYIDKYGCVYKLGAGVVDRTNENNVSVAPLS